MGALDLDKVAVAMGKVLKQLTALEAKVKYSNDVYERKESFYALAYICRVAILDRIEENNYMHNPLLPIKIPTGIISFRSETMSSALSITIGKLKELASKDLVTETNVIDILNRGDMFYTFQRILPNDFIKSL